MEDGGIKAPVGIELTIVSIAISLAVFMQVLDTSIANVAIPYISGGLAVSVNQGTWVITSFAVGNAIGLPLTGWLTKKFGKVKTMIVSIRFSMVSTLRFCGCLMFPLHGHKSRCFSDVLQLMRSLICWLLL